MPRSRSIPTYRYHISGQAIVTFCQKNFYLGPHNSQDSFARYNALVAEYIANGMVAPPGETRLADKPLTVACITAAYRRELPNKFPNCKDQLRHGERLCDLLEAEHAHLPAIEFGPSCLKQIRDELIASNYARTFINKQIKAVVGIFSFAVSCELLPPERLVALKTLPALKKGQKGTRETEKVQPVPVEDVQKTAAFLAPVIRAMVRVQLGTGMRPSEVCHIRPCDIDKSGTEWFYRPSEHKNANKGKIRAVPILGDVRDALEPYMDRPSTEYCFSPRESYAWHKEQRRKNRKTPDGPGRNKPGTNRVKNLKWQPNAKFGKDSYRQAIQRAASKAGVPHWFPYMLRHTAQTEVRKTMGLEYSQALGGASTRQMAEHYAQLTEETAIAAAAAAPRIS